MRAFKGCFSLSQSRKSGREDPIKLASETPFSVNEVEALYDLFKKLSSSIIKDNLIHKEEFRLALFSNSSKHNIFAEKVFDLFDVKRNGVIEFGEFVRSLSIFHPNASEAEKITFAFRLFDLRDTGYIEREEAIVKDMTNKLGSAVESLVVCSWLSTWLKHLLTTLISYGPPAAMIPSVIARSVNSAINGLKLKEMVLAVLAESDTILSSDDIETIVDKTMTQADLNGDGKIDQEEWREFVAKNPSILKNMTLPYLKEVTLAFPSFVLNTEVE